ncbi:MAG: aminoacetone oxidase family FAD-binding enzyme [Clostridia bacterium]|nr:aminoacetone oxidase family FAD-binding enzyme [Clostridia bacterium]
MKVAIIGAGFAGLCASVLLKKAGVSFCLYERQARAGKKLLATGNGRCNLTNKNLSPDYYYGDRDFASYALSAFDNNALIDFMLSIGVPCVAEENKIFPRSLQASSILDMLRLAEGECEICEKEVKKIVPSKNGFKVVTDIEESFDKVLICCGGKASKSLSGGGSYNLLTDLGYKLTPLKPAIVQLKCDGTKALNGIKVNGAVTIDNRTEKGEILFTAYGLSGPPVLQIARDASGKTVDLDLVPDLTFNEILELFNQKQSLDYLTAEHLFTGFLNKQLGRELLRACDITPFSTPVSKIKPHQLKALANKVKKFSFEIKDTNGFENAQVTAGGISCEHFDKTTMESKKHKGLYLAGEILDVDGECGGYNLQWAFSSACVAVEDIIK